MTERDTQTLPPQAPTMSQQFLEETSSTSHRHPGHAHHRKAARTRANKLLTSPECRRSPAPRPSSPSIFQMLIVLLFVVLALYAPPVSGQVNFNTLVPEVTGDTPPFEELVDRTFLCSVRTTHTLRSGQTALTWSRDNGLPQPNTVVPSSRNIGGGITTYESRLTFRPRDSDNGKSLICSATVGDYTGEATYVTDIILRPDTPNITGPDVIKASDEGEWTCLSEGASDLPPNVYYRNQKGEHLFQGVSQTSTVATDLYGNLLYTIRVFLKTTLPTDSATYRLTCYVVHEDTANGYSVVKESTKEITVLFPPQVTKTGGDRVMSTEGTRQEISCQIQSSSPAALSVSWTRNGTAVNVNNGRYEGGTVSLPSLIIRSVSEDDQGDYVCSVTNAEGTGSFATPTTIVVRFTPVIEYPGGTSFSGSVGGQVTLPCPVQSVPLPSTIRWKRTVNGVDTYLDIAANPRYSGGTAVNQQYGLTINPLQSDDQDGVYACEADNDVSTGNGPPLTLIVNTRPIVTTPQTSVNGRENNPVTLTCDVNAGAGLTDLTWSKDGLPLTTSDRSKYTGGTTSSPSLTVQSLKDSDAGVYVCLATNAQGTTRGNDISLNVQYGPRISVPSRPIIVNSGQPLTLSCSVIANPSVSELYWVKDTTGRIDPSSDSRYSGGTIDVPSLTIDPSHIDDSGAYNCVARNAVGTNSSSIALDVVNTPQLTATLATPTVEEGVASVTLECIVNANPYISSLSWNKGIDTIDIAGNPGKYSGGTIGTTSLTILSVDRDDAGSYTCSGTNLEGTGSSLPVQLVVTYRPTLNTSTTSVTGRSGEFVTLPCDVSAVPALTSFYWTKDGARLNLASPPNKYSGGTLALYALTINGLDSSSDPGAYRCVAENARGVVSSDVITLAVSPDPKISVDPSVTANQGDAQLVIRCDVTMFPPASSLLWFKNNQQLDVTSDPSKYSGGTLATPTLTVLNPDRTDSGTYRCRASNGDDTVTSPDVTVSIQYVPIANVASPKQESAQSGAPVSLTCDVTAVPNDITYRWFQGNTELAGANTRILSLVMNDDADFGSYTCIASNTLGEGAQIKFNVQEVGGPAVGASTDEGLSTVTIILIAIIVIILLIIIVLLIIFCCLQGACGRAKEKGKVAPTPPPRSVPMYGGGHFGPTIAPHSNGTIKVDEEAGFTPKEEMLATGLIISVPEKAGGRAHHLPPLDTHKDVENYYREERRRSRKKKYRRTQEDRNVLTEPNGDVQ